MTTTTDFSAATPRPWAIARDEDGCAIAIFGGPNRSSAAHMPVPFKSLTRDAIEANAALIVAAVNGYASAPAAPRAGVALAKNEWWCPTCAEPVPGEHVTFEETHDPRRGGCGDPVMAEMPPALSIRDALENLEREATKALAGKLGLEWVPLRKAADAARVSLYAHPHTVLSDSAWTAVEAIFEDIRGRKLLKWLFPEEDEPGATVGGLLPISVDVQEQIKAAWRQIIENAHPHPARPGAEDAEPAAAETWFTYPKMVQHDGRVAFVRTPPGLYLSKGDGEIVPVAAPADAGAARVAELVEATTAIVDHPGIKVTCEDLDAKAAWDRLGEAIAALAAGQDAGERG